MAGTSDSGSAVVTDETQVTSATQIGEETTAPKDEKIEKGDSVKNPPTAPEVASSDGSPGDVIENPGLKDTAKEAVQPI